MAEVGTPSANGVETNRPRAKWGWFVALGVIMLIAGFIALTNIFVATVVSALYVGAMMLVAGIAQVIEAFQVRHWGAFFFWLVSGLLYAVAGLFALWNPALAAGALTLLLAISLIVAGILRIVIGLRFRPASGWGWIVSSAVITLIVGVILALGWPANTTFVLGIFLAVDLTFQGVAMIALGMALKPDRSEAHA